MKKKCFNALWVAVLSLLFTLGTGAFSAALAQTVSFPTNHGVTPGAAAIIPVNITGAEGAGIGGYGLRIDYDETVLSNPSADTTGTWSEGNADLAEGAVDDGVGKYAIAIGFGFSATDDSKPLVNVRFDVAADFTGDPASAVTFEGDNETKGCFLQTSGFDPIVTTWTDGSVTVKTDPIITASITAGEGSITYGGTSAIGERTFSAGDTPAYAITPNSGYKITSVLIDDTKEAKELLVDQAYTFAELADGDTKTIAVTFTLIDQPTITATITDGADYGSITFNDAAATGVITHAVGDTPTYKVTPQTGYKVASFTVDTEPKELADDGTYMFRELVEGDELAVAVSFVVIEYPKITATGDDNVTITSDSGVDTDPETAPGEKSYAIGDEPKYTVSFSTGYKLGTLTVTLNGSPVADAVLGADNTYTFAPLAEGDVHSIVVTSTAIDYPKITATADENGSITSEIGTDTENPGEKWFEVGATPVYTVNPADKYRVLTFTVDGIDKMSELATNTYTFDALAEGETHKVNVTFELDNIMPVATPGELEAELGTITVGQLFGTDEDGTIVSYQIVGSSTKGFAEITDAATGAYQYEPRGSTTANDTDSFTFTVTDNQDGVSEPATVTITFIDPCTLEATDGALDVAAGTTKDGSLEELVTYDCSGTREYSITVAPTKGRISAINAATGAYTYKADADATESDTFTFQVTDGNKTDTATVTVSFGPPNIPPVAVDGALNVVAGTTATGTLVATDADGDALTYSIVVNGTQGTATVTDPATGAYTYTANAGVTGTDTFTFKASDGEADSNIATVTVTLGPVTEYEVTGEASPEAGGSVLPIGASVIEGGDVTFTVTVTDGWEIGTVTDNEVAVTLEADNTYTITAIAEDHDIVVVFKEEVPEGTYSSADMDMNYEISLSELLSVVQLYTTGTYHCDPTEVDDDGYAPGDGDQSCAPHTADYNEQDWEINLSELLRSVQFYVLSGYHVVPEGEVDEEGDGFIAGAE